MPLESRPAQQASSSDAVSLRGCAQRCRSTQGSPKCPSADETNEAVRYSNGSNTVRLVLHSFDNKWNNYNVQINVFCTPCVRFYAINRGWKQVNQTHCYGFIWNMRRIDDSGLCRAAVATDVAYHHRDDCVCV